MSKRKVVFSEQEDPDFLDMQLDIRPGQVRIWRGGKPVPVRVIRSHARDGYDGMWLVKPVDGGMRFTAAEHDLFRV